MKIKIKKMNPNAVEPMHGSRFAAGYDLCAAIDEPMWIAPGATARLDTGIAFEIPEGWCGLIFARSGLSTKNGLRPATCVSVIDSDYRGVVGVPLYNDSAISQCIKPGERISQIVFVQHADIEFVEDDIGETERGVGGFGSTGR